MKKGSIEQGVWAIMAALTLHAAAWAQAPTQASAEAALLQMREAHRQGDSSTLTALLPSVRGHALEPLAAYWDMKTRLDEASPAEIRGVLVRYTGSYWEDRLRNDWLLLLGERRDWTTFADELPRFRMNDDPQVKCYAAMLDAVAKRVPPEEAARQVVALWHAQPQADDGCATAAKTLFDGGALKADAVWQRARLATEQGKADVAVQAAGLLNPDWGSLVAEVARNPVKYLDEKITAIRPRTKELVSLAIIGLAQKDAQAAAEEMQRTRWRAQLTEEEKSWVWGAIGRRAAKEQLPEALAYFANGQERWMHADQLAWKARAALRQGQWSAVRDATNAMGERQRKEPVWRYWRARGLQALKQPEAGAEAVTAVASDTVAPSNSAAAQAAPKPLPSNSSGGSAPAAITTPTTAPATPTPPPPTPAALAESQARALYESIAEPTGFYELLAMEALGLPVQTPPVPAPLLPDEIAAANQNLGLQRALAAMRLGLRSEGVREWNYSVALHTPGGMGERALLAAAALACQQQIWDRCISTSERTRSTLDHSQRFPMPLQNAVVARSREVGLDPAYVYGLIRQESRFVTDARSGVGASGLMQVMPATARWTARKIGLSNFKSHQINEQDTNITIGTAYLKLALDDFEGSLPLAAAAYNAGPSRARDWREGTMQPGDVWVENIPFDETRDYVRKVLANTTLYAARMSGRPQSLRARLGQVGPRPADQPEINRDLP